jgi:hypothetical protein
MPRKVDPELIAADIALSEFVRYQHSEAKKLGYPRMSTFAKDIARGDIGLPPPTEVNPWMELIGKFFWGLKDIERRIASEHYLKTGTIKVRARACGISSSNYDKKLNRIRYGCSVWIKAMQEPVKEAA